MGYTATLCKQYAPWPPIDSITVSWCVAWASSLAFNQLYTVPEQLTLLGQVPFGVYPAGMHIVFNAGHTLAGLHRSGYRQPPHNNVQCQLQLGCGNLMPPRDLLVAWVASRLTTLV